MANIFTSQSGLSHAAKAYVMAGRGFVVDVAGRGDFTSIQTACNALYARGGGGRVWIRNGTYYETIATNASHDNLVIEGESWDTVIDGGTTNAHTCHVLGDYCTIQNIQVKNTQGAGNTAMAVFLKGDHGRARMVYVSSSDKEGIYGEGSDWRVLDCLATTCDSRGIYFEAQWGKCIGNTVTGCGDDGIRVGNSDNSIYIGNKVTNCGAWGIIIYSFSDNIICTGNRVSGNTSGQISNSSTNSVVANNDET